jgi:hypothetical protein
LGERTVTFEGVDAANEAATLAAKFGATVEHEGVLFSVTYDESRQAPASAPRGTVDNDTVAAAIAAARNKRA